MVVWCMQNMHWGGSSFMWHQPCNSQNSTVSTPRWWVLKTPTHMLWKATVTHSVTWWHATRLHCHWICSRAEVSVDVKQHVYLLANKWRYQCHCFITFRLHLVSLSFPVTLASIPDRWIPSHRRPARLGPQERHLFPPLQSHPVLAENQTVTSVDEHQHWGHPWWRHLHSTARSVLLTCHLYRASSAH